RSISRTASTISWLILSLPFLDQIHPHDAVVRYVDGVARPVRELQRALARRDDLATRLYVLGLDAHLPPDRALEVRARPQRPVEPRRRHLDAVVVEVAAQHVRDPLAERVVDTLRMVDVDAEALLPGELQR